MQTCKKYSALLIYCNLLFALAVVSNPLSPIGKTVKSLFLIDIDKVSLATSLFSFIGIFTGIPSNIVIEIIGIRRSVIAGSLLLFCGMALRMLYDHSIYFIHAGEVIAGFGNPLIQNGLANFAMHWFIGTEVDQFIIIERNCTLNSELAKSNWSCV